MADITDRPQRASKEALAAAGHLVAQAEAAAEAKFRAEETAQREREAVAREAISDLLGIMERLFDQIEASSEAVRREKLVISLGPARLSFTSPQSTGTRTQEAELYGAWDVRAFSVIKLQSEVDSSYSRGASSYTFSASLVYACTPTEPEYRWREISFWKFYTDDPATPFALNPYERDFMIATSNVASAVNVAHGPIVIDAEDEEDFQDQWLRLFAKAAQKKLSRPMQMPPPASFFE